MIETRRLEVETTLREFLRAFENCDLPAMDRLFAPDSVSFDQIVASSAGHAISDVTPYRRCTGMPPAMRRIALELPTRSPGPPYQSLVPQDLMIQVFGDAAVATFHLQSDAMLRRRTFVFVKREERWSIVHLHASSMQASM